MFTFIACLGLLAAIGNPMPVSSALVQEFRQRDQALLDAYATGDVKVWGTALAANAVYVDENGQIMSRADFLKQLTPLPPGVTGNIAIASYAVEQSGNVVTVVHTDDEREFFHGQNLTAQYLTTETWQQQEGNWKLLLIHVYSVLKEPKAIILSPAELDNYVGRYSAGPGLDYSIRREDDHLVGGREGRPGATLKAEVRDVFFVSGQLRTRKMFERDSGGKIIGFVDRREGSDLVWKKIP
jgi:hypothetical protein